MNNEEERLRQSERMRLDANGTAEVQAPQRGFTSHRVQATGKFIVAVSHSPRGGTDVATDLTMSGTFVHLCANALVIVFKIRSHFASRADSLSCEHLA